MKKICIFCETLASGGIESFLTKLLAQMDTSGLQIDLVVAQREDSVFTDAVTAAGVRILTLSGSKSRWTENLRLFRRLLEENCYDAVHLNAFQGLQLCYLWAARRAGVPVRIAHSHGSGLRKSLLRPVKLFLHTLGKAVLKKDATHRWACSRQAAEFLFGADAQYRFIPNGIDTERFRFRPEERARVRSELGLEDKYVVGCVGRLQGDKNQSFLLDVLSRLLSRRPETLLLLVGDGPARRELEDRAKALGILDHVVFYGLSERVEELLWAMDAFAFPSLSEGLGLAAVEAQAAGLPTLCSESIPEEVVLTSLLRLLPIDPDVWARALAEIPSFPRESFAGIVGRAGFESRSVAALVREAYLEANTKEM